jgi:hypothetical protein
MRSKQKAGSDKPKQGAGGGSGGKMSNDSNKTGNQSPTPKNEGRRTPASRSDRDDKLGSDNQVRGRKGGPGSPSGEGR